MPNFELDKLLIISSLNLFGKPKVVVKNNQTINFDGFLPNAGDYVVHNIHGIGIYNGIKSLESHNIIK